MWVGLRYRERAIIMVQYHNIQNGMTCPCSLSKVNWMFWSMELMWASIPSTWSAGTVILHYTDEGYCKVAKTSV